MEIIYGEILQGVVNSVNVVFTSQKNIDSIIEINIGGLPTTAYTIDGRRIIFNTAPLTGGGSPSIDYYWAEVCTFTADDAYTLGDALSDTLGTIGIRQWSTPYPEATAIKKINDKYKQSLNLLGTQVKGNLSFTKGGIYSYGEFERLDLINVTSTIDNYTPRVGRLMVDNVVVPFNTRTDTSFTLTDPTTFTPETNSIISVGYKLPTCVREVQEVTVDNIPFRRIDGDIFSPMMSGNVFTTIDGYLYFANYIDIAVVNVRYLSRWNKLVESSDEIDIDDEYSDVLSDYAAYIMLQNREDERWQVIEARNNKHNRKWMAFLNRQKNGANNKPFFDGPLNQI